MTMRWIVALGLLSMSPVLSAQSARPKFEAFDVATVRPVDLGPKAGRTFKMEGSHRWVARNFTLKSLIALGYELNPRTISGGPAWMDETHFDVEAVTPGDVQPVRSEQVAMLRALLVERFGLKFHRVDKEFSIYELSVAKGGPKIKAAADSEAPMQLVGIVHPGQIEVPAKSVTMDDFVSMLQRATLDRPVLNKTGLRGKYDFTLTWAQDETQYGGEIEKAGEDAQSPPLFVAMQEQLGLKLTATHGMVSAMVVDAAIKPEAS